MRDTIFKMINDTIEGIVNAHIGDDQEPDEWDMEGLNAVLSPIFPFAPISLSEEQMRTFKKNSLIQYLKEKAVKSYEAKEAEFPEKEALREVERIII